MRGYAAIGLDNPKTPANLGSVMRAAGVYGAKLVAISGKRMGPGSTDTMKSIRSIPLMHVDDVLSAIPFGCVPVAVDLIPIATPLHKYKHPQRAFYIFGAEDQTLGKRIIDKCRDVVYVPTDGCMNLAACVNVVLYDRMAKQLVAIEAKEDRP